SRSQKEIPEINWYAGLAAWRIGEYKKAAEHFTRLSKAAFSENDERAAGAFWAARCHIILGNDKKAVQFLNFARDQGLHFYAMLAERRLYGPIQISWIFSGGNGEEIEKLRNHKAVQRARALNQIGRGEMGEGELLTLHGRLSSQLDSALISLAESEGFAALQIAVADEIRHDLTTGIMAVPAGLFPVPSYEPESGFTLDQALLLALIRQESGFKRRAKSSAGARGLMQLMPTTAAFISKDKSLRRRTGRDKLYRDELNLDLGQEYLEIMLKNETAKNNLVFALGAYNAGPGNMRRWFKDVQFDGDPLLFLESLPVRETRHYLANVLTNLWAYRKRLGQDTPSLDALAAGLWPLYLSLDKNNGVKAEDKQANATKPR
ncbi:MAG: transglycosylase SLT domain-containing protein, partial [Parvibaculales bacterium]